MRSRAVDSSCRWPSESGASRTGGSAAGSSAFSPGRSLARQASARLMKISRRSSLSPAHLLTLSQCLRFKVYVNHLQFLRPGLHQADEDFPQVQPLTCKARKQVSEETRRVLGFQGARAHSGCLETAGALPGVAFARTTFFCLAHKPPSAATLSR